MPVLVSTCGICTLAPGTPSREPPGVSSNASTGETRTSTMLERMRTSRVCPAGSNVTSACVRRMMPACGESAIEVWALAWPLKMDAHAGSRSAASVSARQARPSWPGPRAAGAGRVAPDARSWGKTGSFSNLQACVSIFPNQGFGNDEAAPAGAASNQMPGLAPRRTGRDGQSSSLTLNCIVALAPGLSSPTLQVTEPVPPLAGVVA